MRTALRGLVLAYVIIAVAWFGALKVAPLFGDIGMGFALFVVGIPLLLAHAIAFAIFCGSLVCSARALYRQTDSRTVGGYAILLLSVVSVGILPAICLLLSISPR
jgi:hypothetical protein